MLVTQVIYSSSELKIQKIAAVNELQWQTHYLSVVFDQIVSRKMTLIQRMITLITFSLVLASCATSPTGRHQLMLVSEDSAIASSKQAYITTVKELDAAGKIGEDPGVERRVKTITGRLITEAIKMRPDTADWESGPGFQAEGIRGHRHFLARAVGGRSHRGEDIHVEGFCRRQAPGAHLYLQPLPHGAGL